MAVPESETSEKWTGQVSECRFLASGKFVVSYDIFKILLIR